MRSASVVVAIGLVVAGATSCSASHDEGMRDGGRDVDIEGRWIPEEVPSANLGPSFKPRSAAIIFSGDGSWTASDGCNRFGGTYTIEGSRFRSPDAADYAGTACIGGRVPYDRLLPQAWRVTRSEDDVEFLDHEGKVLLRLETTRRH